MQNVFSKTMHVRFDRGFMIPHNQQRHSKLNSSRGKKSYSLSDICQLLIVIEKAIAEHLVSVFCLQLLLLAQSHERIKLRGTTCRQITCQQRCQEQDRSNNYEDPGISRTHAE